MSTTETQTDPRRVTVPEGECGPWAIDRFTIERGDFDALRYAMSGRSPGPWHVHPSLPQRRRVDVRHGCGTTRPRRDPLSDVRVGSLRTAVVFADPRTRYRHDPALGVAVETLRTDRRGGVGRRRDHTDRRPLRPDGGRRRYRVDDPSRRLQHTVKWPAGSRWAVAITDTDPFGYLERVSVWDVSRGGEYDGHVVKFADGTECTGAIYGRRM